jgi:hypothetical protein
MNNIERRDKELVFISDDEAWLDIQRIQSEEKNQQKYPTAIE